MVWHGQVEPEQANDGTDQTLGLPQRQAEYRAHRQGGVDRQSGITPLTTWRGPRFSLPGLDRLFGKP